jgi:hypothetical protein
MILITGKSYAKSRFGFPQTSSELTWSGSHKGMIAFRTPGGWTLVGHVQSENTMDKIDERPRK